MVINEKLLFKKIISILCAQTPSPIHKTKE